MIHTEENQNKCNFDCSSICMHSSKRVIIPNELESNAVDSEWDDWEWPLTWADLLTGAHTDEVVLVSTHSSIIEWNASGMKQLIREDYQLQKCDCSVLHCTAFRQTCSVYDRRSIWANPRLLFPAQPADRTGPHLQISAVFVQRIHLKWMAFCI